MSGGRLLAGLGAASLSGAVIILAVLLLRAAFQSRTPRLLYCLLWDAALARLFVWDALSSPVSVWRWIAIPSPAPSPAAEQAAVQGQIALPGRMAGGAAAALPNMAESAAIPSAMGWDWNTVLAAVWLAAALAAGAWFLRGHWRSRRLYAGSLPCTDPFVRDYQTLHPLRRRVQVRTSDRISAPLTYGVLRPVVLLPAGVHWPDRAALSFVLEHEYQHIRRFDTLRKGFLAAAACLHWFNPLVWVMYVLCNRDMELACDEAMTARGADRAGYARTLLMLEEQRGRWGLSGSHFSLNALEERIRSIMKHKRISAAALTAVVAAMGITVAAFAASAPETENPPETGYVYDHFQAVEGDVMILARGGEDGERQYSVDGGQTWLSEEDYRARYGGVDWQVEWWSAEDYALWLEEEKQVLQSIIGERGYTGGEGWFTWDQKRVDEAVALYESILEDIKNGALYSKAITDPNGDAVEEVALGSSGPIDSFVTAALDDAVLAAPEPYADAAALLKELKAFGVGGSGEDGLTYRGQLIRTLVDGVAAGDNGYSIQYVYTNPDGAVDVHTLRSATPNPDGSHDPAGELTGVAAEGEPGFDPGLMESAAFSGDIRQATAGPGEEPEGDIEAMLKPYRAFGLSYKTEQNRTGETRLRMSWNGKPVHSLYDTETGTWFANNMHGTELPDGAVDLETVYRGGELCGLRETRPPHDIIHGAQTAVSGGGGKEGQTLSEIFARYRPYGLFYSPREDGPGSLTWNGQAVTSFADLGPDGGAFSYEGPYAEGGLRVYTQYDAGGRLTGLRAK